MREHTDTHIPFLKAFLLVQGLSLKNALDEKELIVSMYNSARKANAQIAIVIMDKDIYPIAVDKKWNRHSAMEKKRERQLKSEVME